MRLAKFIIENLDTILQEWEDFAVTLVPPPQKKDHAMLRDHVKQMLETIAADLARPETGHDQREKSKGRRRIIKTPAATHGADRLKSGFSLVSTMAEYRALRASVTRLWQEAHLNKPLAKAAEEDIIRFNEAIDQAVSESVVSFSNKKEQQTRVFKTILSSLPDLSFTFDLTGKFTYANKALTKLLRLPIEKLVGKNHVDLGLPMAAAMQE